MLFWGPTQSTGIRYDSLSGFREYQYHRHFSKLQNHYYLSNAREQICWFGDIIQHSSTEPAYKASWESAAILLISFCLL